MPSLPKTLNINGIPYRLILYKGKTLPDNEGQPWLGLTDNTSQQIQLAVEQKPHTVGETLLHELIHVSCYNASLRYGIPGFNHETEEFIVDSVSRNLFGILVSNPKVLEYLLSVSRSKV